MEVLDRAEEYRFPADWYLAAAAILSAFTARILHRIAKSGKVGPEPAHKRAFLLFAQLGWSWAEP